MFNNPIEREATLDPTRVLLREFDPIFLLDLFVQQHLENRILDLAVLEVDRLIIVAHHQECQDLR